MQAIVQHARTLDYAGLVAYLRTPEVVNAARAVFQVSTFHNQNYICFLS